MKSKINRSTAKFCAFAFFGIYLTMTVVFCAAAFAQNLSGTQYTALRISWPANPPSENVGWYIVEFNDEGLADDTYSVVDNTNTTSMTITFQRLSAIAGGRQLNIDEQMCLQVRAARSGNAGTETSDPSEPVCFTMRGDSPAPTPDAPAGISAPTNVSIELLI